MATLGWTAATGVTLAVEAPDPADESPTTVAMRGTKCLRVTIPNGHEGAIITRPVPADPGVLTEAVLYVSSPDQDYPGLYLHTGDSDNPVSVGADVAEDEGWQRVLCQWVTAGPDALILAAGDTLSAGTLYVDALQIRAATGVAPASVIDDAAEEGDDKTWSVDQIIAYVESQVNP